LSIYQCHTCGIHLLSVQHRQLAQYRTQLTDIQMTADEHGADWDHPPLVLLGL